MSEGSRCRLFMGYSYQLATRVFYVHHSTNEIVHTAAFVIPVVELTGWNAKQVSGFTTGDLSKENTAS